jgi:aspartate/methionine/tyrosine aminotransferase
MAAFKDYTTICSSAPSEVLSIMALRAKEQIVARHLTRLQRNLDLLDRFFDDYKDQFEWVRPKAGTIAFPRLKGSEGALAFCQRAIREANIMLLPATVYDYDDQHVRLGFGRENMPEALEKLRAWLEGSNQ